MYGHGHDYQKTVGYHACGNPDNSSISSMFAVCFNNSSIWQLLRLAGVGGCVPQDLLNQSGTALVRAQLCVVALLDASQVISAEAERHG